MTVLPSLKGRSAHIKTIASSGGFSGTQLAKYMVLISTTDYKTILNDEDIDTIVSPRVMVLMQKWLLNLNAVKIHL